MVRPNEERDSAIVAGFCHGKRYSDLADEHGIGRERVRQIVRHEARRLNLFDHHLPEDPTPEDFRLALNDVRATKHGRRWADLLPAHMASEQTAWEKNHAIKRALEAGATRREIADHLRISYSNVCQRLAKAERHPTAPIERYLGETPKPHEFPTPVRAAHERRTVYEALVAKAQAEARYPFDQLRDKLAFADREIERSRARMHFLERAVPELQRAVEATEAKYIKAHHEATLARANLHAKAERLAHDIADHMLAEQRERDLNRRRVLVASIRWFAQVLKAAHLWTPESQEYLDAVNSDPTP
jgi:hypothetical protein